MSSGRILTERLELRRPTAADADAIFSRYAADPDVTRYVGWERHRSVIDTRAFLAFSDAEWDLWGTGPLLAFTREDRRLVGSAGLAMETPYRAMTGYVFARDAWGRGYATESLRAMVDLAAARGIVRLYAICHTDHEASWRVMEKCGFEREGVLRRHTIFPNVSSTPCDVLSYSRILPLT
jgi:RimJ/RimL family protein N-acetyltransferase